MTEPHWKAENDHALHALGAVPTCPGCGAKKNDGSVAQKAGTKPAAGALSICVYCTSISIYTDEFTQVLISADEWQHSVPPEQRTQILSLALQLARRMPDVTSPKLFPAWHGDGWYMIAVFRRRSASVNMAHRSQRFETKEQLERVRASTPSPYGMLIARSGQHELSGKWSVIVYLDADLWKWSEVIETKDGFATEELARDYLNRAITRIAEDLQLPVRAAFRMNGAPSFDPLTGKSHGSN